MKPMTRQTTAAMILTVILVAGMASGRALAGTSDTLTNPPVEQRNHTMGPLLSSVAQPKGTQVVVSGPEVAKRSTSQMSWVSRSQAVPRMHSLSPVFGGEEGYVGLSWRF